MKNINKEDIGCCGAVCGTCKVKIENACIGCKTGYKCNERNLIKAKCKIKICCITRNYETCADCSNIQTCEIINSFHNKSGYKYKKYKEAIYYIIKYGYSVFLEKTKKWTMQYGKYE